MTKPIAADQLIYTSCRHAIGGGSGFQVQSHSRGVMAGDLMTIAQRSRYVRPRGPGFDDEAPARYPVGFRWYALPSGGRALTRVRYAGVDYTGRPGNFFAHSIVLDSAQAVLVDPLTLFGWPGWRDALLPGEDAAPDVAPLPGIDLHPAVSDPGMAVRSLPGARGHLEAILIALFDAVDRGRKLVIRTDTATNNDWFRLLGMALPAPVLGAIEFSSLETGLQQAPLLSATVEGTEIDFASGDRGDCIGVDVSGAIPPQQRAARATGPGPAYAAAVTSVLFDNARLIAPFRAHLGEFSGSQIGPELTAAAQIFLRAEGIDTGHAASVTGLVRIALRKQDAQFAPMVAKLLAPMRSELGDDRAEDQLLLAHAAAFSAESGHAAAPFVGEAASAWVRGWLAALLTWPADEAETGEAGLALNRTLGPAFPRAVRAALLDPQSAKACETIARAPIVGAVHLFEFVNDLLRSGGLEDPIGESDLVSRLVGAAIRAPDAGERLWALLESVKTVREKALILGHAGLDDEDRKGLACEERQALLGSILAGLVDAMPVQDAARLRKEVPPETVVAEWALRIAGGNALEQFRRYQFAFLGESALPKLNPEHRLAMYRALALAVEQGGATPEEMLVLVEELVRGGQFAGLDAYHQERLLGKAVLAISFDDKVPATGVALIREEAKRLRLMPVFDRVELHAALREIAAGRIPDGPRLTTIAETYSALPMHDRAIVHRRLTYYALRNLGEQADDILFHRFLNAWGELHFAGDELRFAIKQLAEQDEEAALLALLDWWFTSPQAMQRFAQQLWEDSFEELVRASITIDRRDNSRPIARRFLNPASGAAPNSDYHARWQDAYRHRSATMLDRTRAAARGIAGLFSRKPSDRD